MTDSFDLWLGRRNCLEAKKQGTSEEDLGKLKQTILAPMVTALGLSASGLDLFSRSHGTAFRRVPEGFPSPR